MKWICVFFEFLSAVFKSRSVLLAESYALRLQILAYKRDHKKPKLTVLDRVFWIGLMKYFSGLKNCLLVVKPSTVIKWHQLGFKLFWRWKCDHGKPGRPPKEKVIRDLIKKMVSENINWGSPRIQKELALLGYTVCPRAVAKYMRMYKPRGPASQTWRTFIKNHMTSAVACDFFVVPTFSYRLLYVFIILSHDRRRIEHFNVIEHPHAQWAARNVQQYVMWEDEPPRYIHRDGDGIYGNEFKNMMKMIDLKEVVNTPGSPWQNPYCERVIGTLRRDCFDHVIIKNEGHLMRIMREYVKYYNNVRPHSSLDGNAPNPRGTDPPENGKIESIPVLGGLHHQYKRIA